MSVIGVVGLCWEKLICDKKFNMTRAECEEIIDYNSTPEQSHYHAYLLGYLRGLHAERERISSTLKCTIIEKTFPALFTMPASGIGIDERHQAAVEARSELTLSGYNRIERMKSHE